MRIGVMLRGVDKKGGSGIYAQNLVPELLRQGSDVEWVLIYSNASQLGSFELPSRAEEVVVPSVHPVSWDQLAVPRFARRRHVDLLFHTKFTVPLRGDVPAVMALHGGSWYVEPSFYPWWDNLYIRTMMPLYCRRAIHMISNSECTTEDYVNLIGADRRKITTVPLAAAPCFRPIIDAAELARVRRRYHLPDGYILSVSVLDVRKNVPRLLRAFHLARRSHPCHLVLVGADRSAVAARFPEIAELLDDHVICTGWVPQHDLPAIYSMARIFFFPSIYEEFGIPNCEALACGTPILTANRAGPPEIVGDAGLLVDPLDVEAMRAGLVRLLEDEPLRQDLSRRALLRSRLYTWRETGRRTLEVLRVVAGRAGKMRVEGQAPTGAGEAALVASLTSSAVWSVRSPTRCPSM